jgi:hypothetical protein
MMYGDVIMLFYPNENRSLGPGGYVTCRKRNGPCVFVEQLPHELSAPPEVEDCLFTVLPKLSFSAQNRYKKLLRSLDDATARSGDELAKLQNLLPSRLQLKEEEIQGNKNLSIKMKGSPVAFGSVIMLKHEASGTFLVMLKERAHADKNTLNVSVSEAAGSKDCWFNLMPAYKTMATGDDVLYASAAVKLLNTKSEVTVHVSTEVESGVPCAHTYITCVDEVNGNAEGSVLKVQPYKPCSQDSSLSAPLAGGEVITIFHSDVAAFLLMKDGKRIFKKVANQTIDTRAMWTLEAVCALPAMWNISWMLPPMVSLTFFGRFE